ncbi:MAG: CHC2 zinc finger domain-containing protein [Fibrobacter sp.]|nr:CHC2 zinc finger domain-containing protein [Fibrobacter sp.]
MTNEELKQFKASISITAVAQSLGVDVVRGKCRCFFPQRHSHGDRTPSVSVSEERGTFRCWVCDDVRGDVISLVQLIKDCSFTEALDWLMEQYPFLVPNGAKRPAAQNFSTGAASKAGAPKVVNSRPAPVLQEMPPVEEKKELISEDERKRVILSFLKHLSPVDNTPAAAWLARRRIYKPVWDKMLLRTITDYGELNRKLREEFGEEVLKYVGLYNDKGNLRYYKYPLIFPYLDAQRRAWYFQARAIESGIVPKEMLLRGTVPYPYNVAALDGTPGWVYLCEGCIDTLTFIGQKINAVGIPGVRSFKVEWLPLFKNKNVVLCLDHDEAGRSGMEYIGGLFNQAGIRNVVLGEGLESLPTAMKEGEDINDWFGGKK